MCGRYAQTKGAAKYAKRHPNPYRPQLETEFLSWNIPPSAASWVLRIAADGEIPAIDRLTWGFSKPTGPALVSNARVETAPQLPTFAPSWHGRRCLVPIDGWYEWQNQDGKRPFYFTLPNEDPILLAALWRDDRFCLLTTETHGPLREVHTRRPVALDPAQTASWLDPRNEDWQTETLLSAMVPETAFHFWPVPDHVNRTTNDGPHLLNPRPPEPRQAALF